MKKTYFIKHDQRIRRIIGCDRATLIFDRLEFYSSKQPNGFYKFIEPNSHKLYKKDESWTELLNCHRTSFWRAFKLIGKKHTSRWTFEQSEDKFEGKLYASYYDRNTNRMFFIRNHDAVKELFSKIQPMSELGDKTEKYKDKNQSCWESNQTKNSFRTEENAHSYNDTKKTSFDLSKDKSHASDEIIKKMIEIWTALVEEGEEHIQLTGKRIAFLKKAFTDKFDSCLEKWRKFCENITSSRFLMGEKTSFRATLDWALKFDIIQKIFEGNYGIGDRTPKSILSSQADLQEEILTFKEAQEIKDFRALCLRTVGKASYISYFKNLDIEFREEGEIALIAPHKFGADCLERNCYSYLRVILQGLGKNSKKISILAPGESRGRLIELDREMKTLPNLPPVSTVEHSPPEELAEKEKQIEEQKKAKELEQQRSLLALEEEIKSSSNEPDSIKNFRIKWLRIFGEKNYRELLVDCEMRLGEKETDLIIQPRERIQAIKLEGHWNPELLLDQSLKRVQIYHCIPDLMGKPLIFDRWFGGFEGLEAIEQVNGKNITFANGFDESISEIQSTETNQLRTNLKANISAREYPAWLGGIKVQTIKPDGILVVTFKDKLASDYARVRFSEKILESSAKLWNQVSGLIIREESDYLSVHDEDECLEIDERVLVKQAIQSLMGAGFSGAGQGGGILNDFIPY